MKKPFTFTLLLALLFSFSAIAQPKLNSYPSASATIFLDFDGYYCNSPVWRNGVPFACAASGMTDAQITETFNRVAEDYRPFDINITTDSLVFLAAPYDKRIRIVVTTTSAWYPGVGGVAYIGSFTWGDDSPGFVFSDRLGPYSPKMVAECCSHESGHTVGLAHQSKYDGTCALTATYNDGVGLGESSWAPIMGNSYYRNMSGWNNGPTPYGCAATQDNLTIITTQNGFGYRADDYGDDINTTPTSITLSAVPVNGVISTNSDKDAFKFTMSEAMNFHMDIKPFAVVSAGNVGANLDVKMTLYNSAKNVIRVYDPANMMNISIDTMLTTGTYYMVVDGSGNANISDYGSLGSYSITALFGSLPIKNVNLSARNEKDKHSLEWAITADEPIASITVESSTDGSNFEILTTTSPKTRNFTYTPYVTGDVYYRIKARSIQNQTVYSNVVMLRPGNKPSLPFSVSNFVTSDITINAADKFEYQLSNINGTPIATGIGKQGINRISMSRQLSGMYILQLISNNERHTERIIKQ